MSDSYSCRLSRWCVDSYIHECMDSSNTCSTYSRGCTDLQLRMDVIEDMRTSDPILLSSREVKTHKIAMDST